MTNSNPMSVVQTRIPDAELEDAVADFQAAVGQLTRIYQGPTEILETLMVALLARGHVLVEGVPGVAKTTLMRAFAEILTASFRRVQFTPDMMPTDITGTTVLNLSTNQFELRRGPIFAHVVLGDEINRAPAKTQAAMLEAMAEKQVTIDGTTLALPEPFVVLATQNPVEQEGVYPLPEAQLDRFLVKLQMGYPSAADEAQMLQTHGRGRPSVSSVLTTERINQLSQLADHVVVDGRIRTYIVSLARWTRAHTSVLTGASPRASLALMQASRARALLRGRDFVNVDDVRALVRHVFAHRLLLSSSALIDGTDPSDIVNGAVRSVPYDPA